MSTPKIGDTVERINYRNHGGADIGQRAVVVEVGPHGRFLRVSYPGAEKRGEAWQTRNAKVIATADATDTQKLQWTAIVGEKSRTYHFPDGSKFTVENVVSLCVRPTNHRLVTADGSKFVIPGKFIAITIDAETWSA